MFKVFRYPAYEVILVNALYRLVKQVGGDEFVYVGPGEIGGVRLMDISLGIVHSTEINIPWHWE